MGIRGLWGEVKSVCRDAHLREFQGKRVGVDMYVWLHRAVTGSVDLSTEANIEMLKLHAESLLDPSVTVSDHPIPLNTQFLQWVMGRIELLLHCGVQPVLVFDGKELPMKREEEEERRRNRTKYISEAVDLLRNNPRPTRSEQQEIVGLVERGMDITTELAHAVILMLQDRQLECIVAPYEADAQLAYLCSHGYVDAVISEDSDLLAYWCPVLIAKLDYRGNCQVIAAEDILLCPLFRGFSYNSFLVGCILSGCDYLGNLRHVGVKKAFGVMSEVKAIPDILRLLEEKFGFSREQLNQYKSGLLKAIYCFSHHLVFDPVKRVLVTRTPLPSGVPFKRSILGELLGDELAQNICHQCLYDPSTRTLYKGIYQYCWDRYRNMIRAGQSTLTTFNGFKGLRSPRITLHLGPSGSQTSACSGGIPQAAPPKKTLFTTPLKKVCEATGFCGPKVVRSKYFVDGRWKVTDLENDSSEDGCSNAEGGNSNNSENVCGATAGKSNGGSGSAVVAPADNQTFSSEGEMTTLVGGADRIELGYKLPCVRQGVDIHGDSSDSLGISAGQDVHSSPDKELKEAEVPPDNSCGVGEGANALAHEPVEGALQDPVDKGCTGAENDVANKETLCPFGYVQCGRSHSPSEQCFAGREWASGVGNNAVRLGVQVAASDVNSGGSVAGLSVGSSGWLKRPRGALEGAWQSGLSEKPSYTRSAVSVGTESHGGCRMNSTGTGDLDLGMVPGAYEVPSVAYKAEVDQSGNGLEAGGVFKGSTVANGDVTAIRNFGAVSPKAAELFDLLSYTRR